MHRGRGFWPVVPIITKFQASMTEAPYGASKTIHSIFYHFFLDINTQCWLSRNLAIVPNVFQRNWFYWCMVVQEFPWKQEKKCIVNSVKRINEYFLYGSACLLVCVCCVSKHILGSYHLLLCWTNLEQAVGNLRAAVVQEEETNMILWTFEFTKPCSFHSSALC